MKVAAWAGVRARNQGEESSRAPERLRNTWNAETGRRDGEVGVVNLLVDLVAVKLLLLHSYPLPLPFQSSSI